MTSFEEAQAVFLKASRAAARASAKLAEARKLRNELCPHSELIPREYYFSGGYLNQAYMEYWNECACCGARSEKTREQYSWYG